MFGTSHRVAAVAPERAFGVPIGSACGDLCLRGVLAGPRERSKQPPPATPRPSPHMGIADRDPDFRNRDPRCSPWNPPAVQQH